MIAVVLGLKVFPNVLQQIADDVILWTGTDGSEKHESEVLKEIMENFDFTPCGKTKRFTCKVNASIRILNTINFKLIQP